MWIQDGVILTKRYNLYFWIKICIEKNYKIIIFGRLKSSKFETSFVLCFKNHIFFIYRRNFSRILSQILYFSKNQSKKFRLAMLHSLRTWTIIEYYIAMNIAAVFFIERKQSVSNKNAYFSNFKTLIFQTFSLLC